MIRCPSRDPKDYGDFWCRLSHENRPERDKKPDYVSCVSFSMSRDVLLFATEKEPLVFYVTCEEKGRKCVTVSSHYNYNTKADVILKDILEETYQEDRVNVQFHVKDIIDITFSSVLRRVIFTSKVNGLVEIYFPPPTYRALYYLLGFPYGFDQQGYTIHLRGGKEWISPWPSDMHDPYRLVMIRTSLSEGGIVSNTWVEGFIAIVLMDDMTGGLVDVRLPAHMPFNWQCDLTRVRIQLSTLHGEPIYFGRTAEPPEMQFHFYRD